MYDYEFVRVAAEYQGSRLDSAGYQAAVREYAGQGWRLVQVLVENPAAVVDQYTLIFERLRS